MISFYVDRGLGKTIQTIALIAALLQRDCEVGTLSSVRRVPASGADKGTVPPKMFLILCPTSVLQNWEQEFQAWGSFRVGIYHGANKDAVLDKVLANELEVRVLLCQGLFIRLLGVGLLVMFACTLEHLFPFRHACLGFCGGSSRRLLSCSFLRIL